MTALGLGPPSRPTSIARLLTPRFRTELLHRPISRPGELLPSLSGRGRGRNLTLLTGSKPSWSTGSIGWPYPQSSRRTGN